MTSFVLYQDDRLSPLPTPGTLPTYLLEEQWVPIIKEEHHTSAELFAIVLGYDDPSVDNGL